MVIVLHSGRYTYNVVALLARCEQRRLIMHYKHRMPMPYNIILSSTHYIIIWCEFHHIETAIAATVIITFKIIITIIIFYMYTLKYYVLALWPRSQSIISLSTIMLNAFCVMVCFSFRPTVAAVTLSLALSRALSLHLSPFSFLWFGRRNRRVLESVSVIYFHLVYTVRACHSSRCHLKCLLPSRTVS